MNWALSEVSKKGFTPLITPELVRSSVVEKCGFQPRGQNTQVHVLGHVHASYNCIFIFHFVKYQPKKKCILTQSLHVYDCSVFRNLLIEYFAIGSALLLLP